MRYPTQTPHSDLLIIPLEASHTLAPDPRCGTTWMQQLVLLLLRGSDVPVTPMRDAPWLEMSVSSAATGEASSSPPLTIEQLSLREPDASQSGAPPDLELTPAIGPYRDCSSSHRG